MELVRAGGAAILDHDDVEALIGEAAHCRGHALVGEDAAADDVADSHVGEEEPEVAAGERTVGHLGDDATAASSGTICAGRVVLGQEEVVPAGLCGGSASVPVRSPCDLRSGRGRIPCFGTEAGEEVRGVGDHDILEPPVERRPEVEAGLLGGRQRGQVGPLAVGVLNVDDEERGLGRREHKVVGLGRAEIVDRAVAGLPVGWRPSEPVGEQPTPFVDLGGLLDEGRHALDLVVFASGVGRVEGRALSAARPGRSSS